MNWRDNAACNGMGPDIFFPVDHADNAAATAICDTCPVRQQCLNEAISTHPQGIWGGTTELERETMIRRGPRERQAPQHSTKVATNIERTPTGSYVVRLKTSRQRIYVGCYQTLGEAIAVRDRWRHARALQPINETKGTE